MSRSPLVLLRFQDNNALRPGQHRATEATSTDSPTEITQPASIFGRMKVPCPDFMAGLGTCPDTLSNISGETRCPFACNQSSESSGIAKPRRHTKNEPSLATIANHLETSPETLRRGSVGRWHPDPTSAHIQTRSVTPDFQVRRADNGQSGPVWPMGPCAVYGPIGPVMSPLTEGS